MDGTLALADVGSVTSASVSRDATITAASLDVDALHDLFVWSVSGALAMSDSVSVGAALGIHNLSAQTRAYIGDNSGEPGGTGPDAGTGAGIAGSGRISVDHLGLDASTRGFAGTVSVAGALAKNQDQQGNGNGSGSGADSQPGFISRLKDSAGGIVSGLQGIASGDFASLSALDTLGAKVEDEHEQLNAEHAEPGSTTPPTTPPASPGSGLGESGPSFGIAVSGSASVNLIDQDTRAWLDGAQVDARAGTVSTEVLALNDTTLTSASGSAAITMAKSQDTRFSASIAGAVSYSMIDNDTEAYVSHSALDDASRVAVHALSGGEQTNVALGVSANTSGNQASASALWLT